MKVILCVEGWTERVLPQFFKRWLDPRLSQPIAIKPHRFNGNSHYLSEIGKQVSFQLRQADVVGVIGLLDLYGLDDRVAPGNDPGSRIQNARQHILKGIDPHYHNQFRQHFAVHETEAWLLAMPSLFPYLKLPSSCNRPEDVDANEPPAKLLNRLMLAGSGPGYTKLTTGIAKLGKLNPDEVYKKCPHFKLLMDDILVMARSASTGS